MQQIGDEQQAMGLCQFTRLHALMCVELEDGIERQNLDTCACVEDLTGNACEYVLHHAIRAVVAILKGVPSRESVCVHQAVIDSPGIDADAVKRSSCLPGFPQSCEDLVPQREDVPKAVPAQHHRAVGKP